MNTSRKQTDDGALVRACRRGDPSAWGVLIRRDQRLIYSIPTTSYRIGSEHADEIFQRVAVKLFEKLHQVRKIESLPAWIATTTRRECQAYLTLERRWQPLPDGASDDLGEDPPDVVLRLDAVRSEHALAIALEQLDERCRSLLAALYLEEPAPSYQEISKRLGRPVGSLGPTRARCLGKLRKNYEGLGGEEP
jgi:RNA polymerase sigma factor (sigma-70 family)